MTRGVQQLACYTTLPTELLTHPVQSYEPDSVLNDPFLLQDASLDHASQFLRAQPVNYASFHNQYKLSLRYAPYQKHFCPSLKPTSCYGREQRGQSCLACFKRRPHPTHIPPSEFQAGAYPYDTSHPRSTSHMSSSLLSTWPDRRS